MSFSGFAEAYNEIYEQQVHKYGLSLKGKILDPSQQQGKDDNMEHDVGAFGNTYFLTFKVLFVLVTLAF